LLLRRVRSLGRPGGGVGLVDPRGFLVDGVVPT